MTLPNLLYISPVVPRPSGSGLAMRAHHMLQALSVDHRVYLAVVDHHLKGGEQVDAPGDLCRKMIVVPAVSLSDPALLFRRRLKKLSPSAFHRIYARPLEWVHLSGKRIAKVFDAFSGIPFDTLHAFRLYTAPFLKPFLDRHPPAVVQLDLDDIESVTSRRIGDLYRVNGDEKAASICYRDAALYESAERRLLPRFDRVFVCSEQDAAFIGARYGCPRPVVVPNVIPVPPDSAEAPAGDPFTFLFVGTLRYYPNHDALAFFCREVLPRIRGASPRRFRVAVVGAGMKPALADFLSESPEVRAAGYVPDLSPWYEAANACIAPVRGGGGTRIKIIEAFARNRPVVTTSIGMEGIRATPGEHLLIGDTPAVFARQCLRLMEDPLLRKRLSDSAFRLFMNHYTPDAVRSALRARQISP